MARSAPCAQLRVKGHDRISLADTLRLATARRFGVRLLTLDQDLAGQDDVDMVGSA